MCVCVCVGSSYLQPGADLVSGLEVINSTNLNYFSPAQKAELFCLKGLFLHRMSLSGQEDHRVHYADRASEGNGGGGGGGVGGGCAMPGWGGGCGCVCVCVCLCSRRRCLRRRVC
jgi:phosphatidylinositol kinase/protein kinase (PI-3  family)